MIPKDCELGHSFDTYFNEGRCCQSKPLDLVKQATRHAHEVSNWNGNSSASYLKATDVYLDRCLLLGRTLSSNSGYWELDCPTLNSTLAESSEFTK